MTAKTVTAEEFDALFDAGHDVSHLVDWTKARRVGPVEMKRVNVDFPQWMVARLDAESTRLGVTRQSLIKMWIAEKLG
jgi:hypothetical protein